MGHYITYEIAEDENHIWRIAEDFAYYNADRRINPNGEYHGVLTIHKEMQPFETHQDAHNYLQHTCTKRCDDHAVPFYAPVKQRTNKKIQDLQRRILETRDKYYDLDAKSWIGYRTSAYIGCPECGSKIDKKHLKQGENLCPCCRTDLRPPSTHKRLNGYIEKIKELENRLKTEEKIEYKKGKQVIMWLAKLEIDE